MTRLFCVAVVVGAVVLAAPTVWASVPSESNSTVVWVGLQQDAAIICPAGDGSSLDVTVRDQFNAPMQGVLVTAEFDAHPDTVVIYGAVQGFTDVLGYVNLSIPGSCHTRTLVQPGHRTSGTTVRCLGVILYQNQRPFLSPDYNPDQTVPPDDGGWVGFQDFGYFAIDWLAPSPAFDDSRSNFDRLPATCATGMCAVEFVDFGIFAIHWLH